MSPSCAESGTRTVGTSDGLRPSRSAVILSSPPPPFSSAAPMPLDSPLSSSTPPRPLRSRHHASVTVAAPHAASTAGGTQLELGRQTRAAADATHRARVVASRAIAEDSWREDLQTSATEAAPRPMHTESTSRPHTPPLPFMASVPLPRIHPSPPRATVPGSTKAHSATNPPASPPCSTPSAVTSWADERPGRHCASA